MGFIEDERRRKAAELSAQQRVQSIREQQERERDQKDTSAKVARIARKKEAEQQFEQSGLKGMIDELGEIGSHKSARERDPKYDLPSNYRTGQSNITLVPTEPVDHYYVDITVGVGSDWRNDKKVGVEVTPDGTIKIQGGLFGHTTLPRDKWQEKGGLQALEQALGKAYKHPMLVPRPSQDNSVVGDHPNN